MVNKGVGRECAHYNIEPDISIGPDIDVERDIKHNRFKICLMMITVWIATVKYIIPIGCDIYYMLVAMSGVFLGVVGIGISLWWN